MTYSIKRVNAHLLAVILLAFGVFMVGLNTIPVPTIDGAVRAVMSKTLLENHTLWPISYNGQVFHDHPPLFVWLTKWSMQLFGVNDYAVIFVPRFFAFLTVIITGLICMETGLSPGVALLSAIILVSTRDFVLSSVRGYIEPVLEFFIYSGFWFALYQKRKRYFWPAAMAGICVFLAAFAKGPVALWPLLFFGIFLYWNGQTNRRRIALLAIYLGAIAACVGVWAYWVNSGNYWDSWKEYWFKQVVSSALEGRAGAQAFEPFYFIKILLKYYWPWLPLLLFAIYRAIKGLLDLQFSPQLSYTWVFGLFGFGFVVAFSLMKWKFWYYIAPAYPAFAIFIATTLGLINRSETYSPTVDRKPFAKITISLSILWILLAHCLPIHLYRERASDVMLFKEVISKSVSTKQVWFFNSKSDHNIIATSGAWYFGREVFKVEDSETWKTLKLKAGDWVITDKSTLTTCAEKWCQESIEILEGSPNILLLKM